MRGNPHSLTKPSASGIFIERPPCITPQTVTLRPPTPYPPHKPAQCPTTSDHSTTTATAGASLEADATATTSEATQAATAASDHEVHEEIVAAGATVGDTDHDLPSDETSATVTVGAATEGEVTVVGAAMIATMIATTNASLLQAHAPPAHEAHHQPLALPQRQ